MTKKTLTKLAAAAALAFGMSNASAFSLGGHTGTVEFDFDNFDAGTTYYSPAVPQGNVCNTVGTCDTAAVTPAPGAIGSEDTWGIFNIAAITDGLFTPLWQSSAAERLTGIFYGLDDHNVDLSGTLFTAQSIGGIVDIYLSPGAVPNPLPGPGARVDSDTYPTATDDRAGAILFLRLVFSPGVVLGDTTTTTYQSTFDGLTVAGQGSGFLDVIGGAYMNLFDTDGQADLNGNFHDFTFDVSFNTQGAGLWTVRSQGEAVGAAPEPSTVALLAALALGAGVAGRMHKRSARKSA
jgi:hypothetical protein